MEQTGEYHIPASKPEVWQALHDPVVLAQCVDGCETMEKTGENLYTAMVRTKLGPLRVRLGATMEVVESNPYDQYTLKVSVTGGSTGFGSGSAKVCLEEIDDVTTRLTYEAKGRVGGKLAQLGSRLLHSASKKMSDTFFSNFANVWHRDFGQTVENSSRLSEEEYHFDSSNNEADS